ncbi:hypothetical protein BJ508DRAFT_324568 [Ascobolus immersus RN42]|uniref:Uncharacterized protein n=1 Tax=Ascobolus immersus RN42 TaxID=1160509 RepID=A0A3N4IBS2_ASCIM|nr:hypothetical protein BJ508DRAFT_324568 [Ascobolus immersus RN42]
MHPQTSPSPEKDESKEDQKLDHKHQDYQAPAQIPSLVLRHIPRIDLNDLPTISPPPFISPTTHQTFLSHFSTLPASARGQIISFDEDEADVRLKQTDFTFDIFLTTYLLLCRHHGFDSETFTQNPPTYPPALWPAIEDVLLFFLKTLQPYFSSIGVPFAVRTHFVTSRDTGFMHGTASCFKCDPREPLLDLLLELGDPNISASESVLLRRHEAGLLRDGQVQLVEIVLRGVMVQLGAMIEVECAEEELRLRRMMGVCTKARELLLGLLVHRNFRSERLEGLLLGYLREEGVNWRVVRGVEAAEKRREREKLRMNEEEL